MPEMGVHFTVLYVIGGVFITKGIKNKIKFFTSLYIRFIVENQGVRGRRLPIVAFLPL